MICVEAEGCASNICYDILLETRAGRGVGVHTLTSASVFRVPILYDTIFCANIATLWLLPPLSFIYLFYFGGGRGVGAVT